MRRRIACALALIAGSANAQPEPPKQEEPAPPPEQPQPPPAKEPDVAPPVTAPPTRSSEKPGVDVVIGTPVVEPVKEGRGFRFGSYGRVIAGTDLRGGKPESANVVAHGPRIVESSYLELDFSYGFDTKSGKLLRPVITLAFDGTLFHDTGDFDARPALRNMYLDAQLTSHLTGWVGSRMYRGDDIYLFDYWPLDDLNTVGGGLLYKSKTYDREQEHYWVELATHAGVNRLNRDFQFQQIEVPNPEQGATTVVQLNRQRLIASATATLMFHHQFDANGKIKLHGEIHSLTDGTRKRVDGTFEDLPADTGMLVGAEIATWGWAKSRFGFRRHLNAFVRYAKGLAAFDELAPPTSFGSDLKTQRANELSFGLSGNLDAKLGNMMLGVLSRRFVDADANTIDFDDGWEYAVDARPLLNVTNDVFIGADVSYQARFPRGINPITERAEDASVFQIAPMLVYSPMGPSSYDRPQIRIVYRAAHLNDGARDLFVPDDPRHAHAWTYFLGLQAEWWFNSSTYQH